VDGLRFQLLGTPEVRRSDPARSEVRLTRLLQSLLAYLLVYRDRSHSRDVLVGVFWGDESEERGRSCLTTALWRLRRGVVSGRGAEAYSLVSSAGGDVHLDARVPFWLDVAELETWAQVALRQPVEAVAAETIAHLSDAVRLYRGDLLEGFYDEWVLRERERLRLLYQDCLGYLMRYHRSRDAWADSLTYGGLLLQHDPLREDVHREVMRLYMRAGQRTLALRQYEFCREILARELGIRPMEETEALHAQLLHASGATLTDAVAAVDGAIDVASMLQRANAAKRTLEATVDELKRLIRLLEGPDGTRTTALVDEAATPAARPLDP
jgi:DNA-binding SARP family transcriptional activator